MELRWLTVLWMCYLFKSSFYAGIDSDWRVYEDLQRKEHQEAQISVPSSVLQEKNIDDSEITILYSQVSKSHNLNIPARTRVSGYSLDFYDSLRGDPYIYIQSTETSGIFKDAIISGIVQVSESHQASILCDFVEFSDQKTASIQAKADVEGRYYNRTIEKALNAVAWGAITVLSTPLNQPVMGVQLLDLVPPVAVSTYFTIDQGTPVEMIFTKGQRVTLH